MQIKELQCYWCSLRYEFPRVKAWHKRHDPITKKNYSWLEALKATVENTPSFDDMWDEDMEK